MTENMIVNLNYNGRNAFEVYAKLGFAFVSVRPHGAGYGCCIQRRKMAVQIALKLLFLAFSVTGCDVKECAGEWVTRLRYSSTQQRHRALADCKWCP